MNRQEFIKRYIYFFIGIFIISFGIALSTRANMGVTAISSIPYVLNLAFPGISMGKFTMLTQICYILIQWMILKKEFKIYDWLQVICVIVFGYFVDFSLFLVSWVDPQVYVMKWVVCLISMFIIAFGLNFEVRASVLMVASDGLLSVISDVYRIEFGKVKIVFDCVQVVITLILCATLLHHLAGIREGTVAAAIGVGMISKFYGKHLDGFYKKIGLIKIPKGTQRKKEQLEAQPE